MPHATLGRRDVARCLRARRTTPIAKRLLIFLVVVGIFAVSLGAVARRGQIVSPSSSRASEAVPLRESVAESLVAVENTDSSPFQVGEKLTYKVKLRRLPAGKRVDNVVQKTTVNGQRVYHIRSEARTKSIFRLYHFRNEQETYILRRGQVSESLLRVGASDVGFSPVRFRNQLEDRKYRATVIANFLQTPGAQLSGPAGEIAYEKISRKDPESPQRREKKTLAMPTGTQDELSMLYFLRGKCLTLGKTYFFPLLAKGKVQKVTLTVERRDIVKNKALGPVRTLVLRTSNGSRLWLTDDSRRIPVQIEATSKIGTMKATLEKVEFSVSRQD